MFIIKNIDLDEIVDEAIDEFFHGVWIHKAPGKRQFIVDIY